MAGLAKNPRGPKSYPVAQGLSATDMFMCVFLDPSLKFHLTVLSFLCWNSHHPMRSSGGQHVVVTSRQTPDTPLLLLCLQVYKHTGSHLSDHTTYIIQYIQGYSVFPIPIDLKHTHTVGGCPSWLWARGRAHPGQSITGQPFTYTVTPTGNIQSPKPNLHDFGLQEHQAPNTRRTGKLHAKI